MAEDSQPQAAGPGIGLGLSAARRQLGMSLQRLWIDYFGLGGNGSLDDVVSWVEDGAEMPDADHNLLAQALNDEFTARERNHPVAYR